jgi:putative transposase
MTVREIQAFLAEMYAVEVSPDLIGTVTDAVAAEVTAWQRRPLEPMYPVVFFDALRVKIRDEATVRSKAVYLALAVLPNGSRDILGLWIERRVPNSG